MRNIFETIVAVIKQPTKFFQSVTKDKGIKDAVLLWLIMYAVNFVLQAIHYIRVDSIRWILIKIFSIPFGIGLVFLFVLIVHGFFKLFKCQGKFKDTFNLMIYTSVPGFLLGIIYSLATIIFKVPVVMYTINWPLMAFSIVLGISSFIWASVLAAMGGNILHKVSKTKSFLAAMILPILFVLLIMLLLGMLFSLGIFASLFITKIPVMTQSLV